MITIGDPLPPLTEWKRLVYLGKVGAVHLGCLSNQGEKKFELI
jgi:hypothetical protein